MFLIKNLESAHGVLGCKIPELNGLVDEFHVVKAKFGARSPDDERRGRHPLRRYARRRLAAELEQVEAGSSP